MKVVCILHQLLTPLSHTYDTTTIRWHQEKLLIRRKTNKPQDRHKDGSSTTDVIFPLQFWGSSSTRSNDVSAPGECVHTCWLSGTFIKWHSLAKRFVACNRFIQKQLPLKVAVIIQHQFSAAAKENAPVIHNITIAFPWQHQQDCTTSNRPKPQPPVELHSTFSCACPRGGGN